MARWITVPDPDDRLAMPTFEGPETDAHKTLKPGLYDAIDFETDDVGQVEVIEGQSFWLDPAVREF